MTYDNLLIEHDGPVVTVTINRPKALNALNPATLEELQRCTAELHHDPSVRCAVVTGSGDRAFVAGADIAAMEHMSALDSRRFAHLGQGVMRQLELLPFPVLAAVNGFALGGGLELALACDLILAASTAKFGQPEVNLGIIPGFGGTQRLMCRIGVEAARRLIYTGEMIDAEEGVRLGLVSRVVPLAEVVTEAKRMAAELAAKAPVALQQAKAAINTGSDLNLDDACRYEAEAFAVAFGTHDRAEGMRAFLEKRPPAFKGR